MRYDTERKSYRNLAHAYNAEHQHVGWIGWSPAAVRNRKAGLISPEHVAQGAGMYSVMVNGADGLGVKIGQAATLQSAKKLMDEKVPHMEVLKVDEVNRRITFTGRPAVLRIRQGDFSAHIINAPRRA